MEKTLSSIVSYLQNVFLSTLDQLIILFGPLLVVLVLLNLSASITSRMSIRFWGRNLFLFGFGWMGGSVHELSHLFFALIFGHKINEIVLFKPNNNGESLGHVTHSYNKKSIYQKIGNFFIGLGPLLAGGIVLFLFTLLLFDIDITKLLSFRITSYVLSHILLLKQLASTIWTSLISFLVLVFNGPGTIWWKTALFIYILYSVGSSITLSKSDISSVFAGFIWFVFFLLIFNLLTLWIGDFILNFLTRWGKYISGFYFLLILSMMANLLFIMILFVLNVIKSLIIK